MSMLERAGAVDCEEEMEDIVSKIEEEDYQGIIDNLKNYTAARHSLIVKELIKAGQIQLVVNNVKKLKLKDLESEYQDQIIQATENPLFNSDLEW